MACTRSPTVRTERKSSGLTLRPITRRMRSMRSTASMLSISRSSPRRAPGTTRPGSISNSSEKFFRSNSRICSVLNIKSIRRARYPRRMSGTSGVPFLSSRCRLRRAWTHPLKRPVFAGHISTLSCDRRPRRTSRCRRFAGPAFRGRWLVGLQLCRKDLQQVRVEGSRRQGPWLGPERRQIDVRAYPEGDPHPTIRNPIPRHVLRKRSRLAADEHRSNRFGGPHRDARGTPVELHRLAPRRARPLGEYYYILAFPKGLGRSLHHGVSGRIAHVTGRGDRPACDRIVKECLFDDAGGLGCEADQEHDV